MASFLRPRRGKKATAISQGLILKRGEFFVEVPDSGIGTGVGKIKMGDGSTSYTNLPYLVSTEDDKIGFTDTSAATDPSNNPTYLTNIAPGNNLKTVFTNLKQLVYNHNSQLAELNNDLTATVGTKEVPLKFEYNSTTGKYGYRDGADTFCPFSSADYSGITYTNYTAANIKKGIAITTTDPNGNILKSVTGTYTVNTFTNLTAANIKNGITVTIKDTAGTTLKTVTGTYTADTKHTVYATITVSGDQHTVTIYVDGVAKTSKTGSLYGPVTSGSISV